MPDSESEEEEIEQCSENLHEKHYAATILLLMSNLLDHHDHSVDSLLLCVLADNIEVNRK